MPSQPLPHVSWGKAIGPNRIEATSIAAGLLPRSSRWLFSARTRDDQPLTVEAILPHPRTLGMPARRTAHPFGLLRGEHHADAALLFLAGTALFLFSAVLGIAHAAPSDPVLPPRPASNQPPLLPMIVASPRLTIRHPAVP
ncbi:MAG: hypothetical protein HY821_09440 [Acidobacteria bacterium]|nr:hypothetical protein [Acidobacteriota bacterium]